MKRILFLIVLYCAVFVGTAFAVMCPNCRRQVQEPGAAYCGYCGQNLNQNQAVYCSQCGNPNDPRTAYCSSCGAPMAVAPQPVYGPAQPPSSGYGYGPQEPSGTYFNFDVFTGKSKKKKHEKKHEKKHSEWRSIGTQNLNSKGAIEFPVNAEIRAFKVKCVEGVGIVNVFVVRTSSGNRDFTIGQRLNQGESFERDLGGKTYVTGFRWGDNGRGKLKIFVK
ncbi:MAG: zinc ribbon domain-containing protein [Candidatus Theseobacter exili]|nr:zinc ribbon domain-containing protein [Candidatus Theseobacter exili]